ncbi:MAG: HDOD domain-containing protein [Candidatus Thiodiazotropha sp. (ex Epidulcina cf. delphinae)]|nr:HDOD domain-containing protein [Candidatus Thiodiazotropha sp. (ex Epidulcina cf. delphinae)]
MPIHSQQKPFEGRFSDLPSPPAILIELIDSCNSPEMSFTQLAETIQKDAGISSQVIAAANSPFYRQWQEISDLQRILVVLGISSVRTIAINSAVRQFFAKLSKQTGRTLEQLWFRSLICAHTARSLAELTAYPAAEEAYLAGLLHSLGQLALLKAFPDDYREILEQELSGKALIQTEQEKLGYTSPQIGSQMIDRWALQSFLSDAVRYQYESTDAILDASHLVKLINLSSRLCDHDGAPDNEGLERADLLFGLNQSIVEQLLQEARDSAAKAAQSLGIPLPSQNNDQHDQRHQEALAERIKQAALLSNSLGQLPEGADMAATLQQIQRDLDLLFGTDQICFLLRKTDEPLLHPVSPTTPKSPLLDEIAVSTESDHSLAARAFNQCCMLFSLDEENQPRLSVADRQLARYLKCDGLVYLPLASRQSAQGLIAVGMGQERWRSLGDQQPLLALFAREAAEMLQCHRDRLASQQQLIDDERAAFHLEARKVVHEANNPLGIINNYLHILGMKLGEEHQFHEELEIIKEEIARVGRIILRIRDIPDALEQQEKGVDINQLIQDLHKLFQASLFATQNIVAELDLDTNIPLLNTQRGHLKQILTNLLKNAVEAMQEGGKLSIATHDNAYLNGRAHIEIVITDNGPGIDQEIMDQLFLPGKTTKDSSHSGLGLAIVKNLIDELSGSINCTSNTAMGTRFQLFLPRTG